MSLTDCLDRHIPSEGAWSDLRDISAGANISAPCDKVAVVTRVEVHGAVDHGIMWSIYFFDPNNLPLEVSWDCMEIIEAPAVVGEDPMAIVAEGADPPPASWPEVTNPTPVERMTAWPGNAYPMREALLANRQARVTGDYEAIREVQRKPVERPEKVMAEAGV